MSENWTPPADYNALVHFLRHHVQPASQYYVTRDDVLELWFWSPIDATTVNLTVRFQTPDGEVRPRFETKTLQTTNPNPGIIAMPNAEGFLLSASVETPGALQGQCFVSLRVKRGGGTGDSPTRDVLLQGYVPSIGALSYPPQRSQSPTEGRGRMRVVTVANPAPGADWSVAVPAGVVWIPRSVTATLTTAVAVATRAASLEISDAVPNVLLRSPAGATQAASLADVYSWFNSPWNGFATGVLAGGLPKEFRALGGWTIGTVTTAIQAADQWSAIALAVEEFIGG